MSGYLERIIAGAKTPASAIRPLVRPLFALSSNERFAGIAEEVSAPAGSPPPARAASREPVPRVNTAVPGPVESIPAGREEFTNPENFADVSRPRPAPTWLMPAVITAAPTSLENHSEEPTAPLPNESPAAINTSVLLVGEVPREVAFQSLMPVATMAPRLNPVSQSPAPAPPPMDEIQIHIGRIEINAIPPSPAPRAATGRPSRGLSLEEYLRRGRGRIQ